MKQFFRNLWLRWNEGAYSRWSPSVTPKMKAQGLKWAYATYQDGSASWISVCDFCGGNCGQCGMTGLVGNVGFSMDHMIKAGNWDKPAYGLPRR